MDQDLRQNTANLEKLTKIFMQPGQEPDSITLSLEALDSPDWERYKSAGGAKAWMQKLMDGEEGAFDECCDLVSDQLSYWPAVYLVVPYLVEKLTEDFDRIRSQEWIRNSSMLGITLATDCAMNRAKDQAVDQTVMDNYQRSIRKFQMLLQKFLANRAKSLSRVDSMDKTFFALGVLAAFGDREDAFLFVNAELDECICIACDNCEHCNEGLEFASRKALSAISPGAQAEDDWNGEDFGDTYRWFGDFLELFKIKGMAKHLPYYFGTYKCPECGREAAVKDLMKNYHLVQ